MRSAPIPYLAGLFVLGFAVWGAFQWAYDRVLEGKDTQIETLKGQDEAAEGRIKELQAQAASGIAHQTISDRDPGMLYQDGEAVATASGGQLDRGNRTVYFPAVTDGGNFAFKSPADYRKFSIENCEVRGSVTEASMAGMLRRSFGDVTCQISGLHP